MRFPLTIAASALAITSLTVLDSASAAELRMLVRTPLGAAVTNAVVTVYPAVGDHQPIASSDPLVVAQKEIAFDPYVLVAPVGSMVTFPNRDTVRHHVYSFSPAHRFELKLYGREEHRTEHFDKAGIVAMGCNIHDAMAAYIDVVDTRFAGKTDSQGRVLISGLPDGPATVKVWHPNAKLPGGMLAKPLVLDANTAQALVVIDLRPSAPGKQDH
jgi:plastocyanin